MNDRNRAWIRTSVISKFLISLKVRSVSKIISNQSFFEKIQREKVEFFKKSSFTSMCIREMIKTKNAFDTSVDVKLPNCRRTNVLLQFFCLGTKNLHDNLPAHKTSWSFLSPFQEHTWIKAPA